MTLEKETRKQELDSAILIDPEILLGNVRDLAEHPEDEVKKAILKAWLLKEWKKANKFISDFLYNMTQVNERKRIRHVNLNDYGICQDPNSDYQDSYIQENAPDIPEVEGVDRAKFILSYHSDKTEGCGKSGGKDVRMHILFIADGENRDKLLAFSIKASSKKPGQVNYDKHEYFAVKVSPELEIAKI